jgi:uncharacterized delta-60 repeat protein
MKSNHTHFSLLLILCCFALCTNSVQAQDGSLDLSFDTDGIAKTVVADGGYGRDITVQSDGKILVCGEIFLGNQYQFGVVRYNTDGSVDNTFDTDGMTTTLIGNFATGRTVLQQSDGKILVAGYMSGNNAVESMALVRYNTDGSLDNTFDSDGIVTTLIGLNSRGYAAALLGDGKILVAGNSTNGSGTQFAVARYNTDGSLDNTFDADGIATASIGNQSFSGNGIALQNDGKIVVVGESTNGLYTDFALTRLNTDGSLDNTFDSDGIVTSHIGTSAAAYSVVVQNDGKLVLSGTSINGVGHVVTVARYNSNGSLDNTFDTDGVATTAIGTVYDDGDDLILQGDGKIVVAGYTASSIDGDIALLRYNSNGNLDSTFDADGIVTTDLGAEDGGGGITLQPDGKILIASYSSDGTAVVFAAVRYNNTLTVATTAPQGKSVIIAFPNPTSGHVTIQWNQPIKGILQLTNVLGEVVLQQTISTETSLDLPTKGIYFARITAGTETYCTKIVVE